MNLSTSTFLKLALLAVLFWGVIHAVKMNKYSEGGTVYDIKGTDQLTYYEVEQLRIKDFDPTERKDYFREYSSTYRTYTDGLLIKTEVLASDTTYYSQDR